MLFIHNLSPVMIELGPFSIRWYGVLFAVGVMLNYLFVRWIFRREQYPLSDAETGITYLFFGLLIGARLGEILFYEPGFYFSNPSEMIKIWNGGLSSHGAAIGVFIAFLIWIRVHKIRFSKYADAFVLGFPITAACVRIGNFFNSEIVGVPTGGNWGVVFKYAGENFPRHPAQLYEAVLSIFIFIFLFPLYKKYYRKTPPMFFMFLYMILYFGGRFIIEFKKDLHVLPDTFPLSMGQVLSLVPLIMAAGYFIFVFPRQKIR